MQPEEIIPKLEIIEQNSETGDTEVSYDGENYMIRPSDHAHFTMGQSGCGMIQSLRQEQIQTLYSSIFTKEDAPEDFKIPLMVHEIEESIYATLGDNEGLAHRHALQAEYLYVLTYFEPKRQQEYFEFAGKLRQKAEQMKQLAEEQGTLKELPEEARNDKEIVITAVEEDGLELQYASETLKRDKEVVLKAVKNNAEALQFASEELKEDEKFMPQIFSANEESMKYMNKQAVIAIVSDYTRNLQFASEEMKNDKKVVLAAVQQNGRALEYAGTKPRNDKEVVLAAVQQDGSALEYAGTKPRNDKEVVLVAVQQDGSALEYADEELRNDKEVVMAAVQQNGSALEYADEELRNDKEVVMVAVQQNGNALKHAGEEPKNNKEVVLAAINKWDVSSPSMTNFESIIRAVGKKILADKKTVLELFKKIITDLVDSDFLEIFFTHINQNLKGDKEIVLTAIEKTQGSISSYIDDELRDDKEVVLAFIGYHIGNLQFVSKRLQNDKEVVWTAFRTGEEIDDECSFNIALNSVGKNIMTDRDSVLELWEIITSRRSRNLSY